MTLYGLSVSMLQYEHSKYTINIYCTLQVQLVRASSVVKIHQIFVVPYFLFPICYMKSLEITEEQRMTDTSSLPSKRKDIARAS